MYCLIEKSEVEATVADGTLGVSVHEDRLMTPAQVLDDLLFQDDSRAAVVCTWISNSRGGGWFHWGQERKEVYIRLHAKRAAVARKELEAYFTA